MSMLRFKTKLKVFKTQTLCLNSFQVMLPKWSEYGFKKKKKIQGESVLFKN